MQCSIREDKNVSISQTSNELSLFSRCLQHNWWYPEEINEDAAISQKPMIANVFMQLSGDQGEKWMHTGMSLFAVSLCLCLCASS